MSTLLACIFGKNEINVRSNSVVSSSECSTCKLLVAYSDCTRKKTTQESWEKFLLINYTSGCWFGYIYWSIGKIHDLHYSRTRWFFHFSIPRWIMNKLRFNDEVIKNAFCWNKFLINPRELINSPESILAMMVSSPNLAGAHDGWIWPFCSSPRNPHDLVVYNLTCSLKKTDRTSRCSELSWKTGQPLCTKSRIKTAIQ